MQKAEWDRVSVKVAARLLGVRPGKIRQLLRAGTLKGRKVCGVWEIPRKQLTKQLTLPFNNNRNEESDATKEI